MRIALTGQPVSTRNLSAVALPKRYALPLFGADGISSVAYAADQMILTLAAAGASALAFSPWIGLGVAMVGLLVIGTYRYNINQIASEGDIQLVHRKLGALPSIVMGASSLMDYTLTVAVSMSSASSFLVALYPQIQDWRTHIAVLLIVALTLFALRGVQLLGKIAYWPLYVFLALLGATLIVGWIRAATGTLPLAESATYVIAPEYHDHALEGLALVLLLARSFSAGLVAFSGVSTISNSVKYFRRPKKYNAAVTMMLMGLITSVLLVSLLGFAAATRVHMVHDTTRFLFIDGHTPGEYFHQKPALYQVALAIYQGVPFFAQLLVFATVGVLIIASLTAFTGFPVIASSLADYQYLPVFFRSMESRGLYANGVLALSAISIFLTTVFNSDVYSLIQLYIVGMCLSMVLVQLAVVRYRMRLLRITLAHATEAVDRAAIRYDRSGDQHYDVVSAFIKSMRGSDADAAVHYLARMLEGGEDPRFVARRIMILASEDIGLADPQALQVATAAAQSVALVGMPEARIILSQAVIYCALAPKSNAAYNAINRAIADVRAGASGQVPVHLRDGHYAGAKQFGHGVGYVYAHDEPGHVAAQQYLPDTLRGTVYYEPTQHGFERTLTERRERIRRILDAAPVQDTAR